MEWHPGLDGADENHKEESWDQRLDKAREKLSIEMKNHDQNDEPKRHPLWEVEGIPAPTADDLKWAKKLDKKISGKLKGHCRKVLKNGQTWRFAKLMEHVQDDENTCHVNLYSNLSIDPLAWNTFNDYVKYNDKPTVLTFVKIACLADKDFMPSLYMLKEYSHYGCFSFLTRHNPVRMIEGFESYSSNSAAIDAVTTSLCWNAELFKAALEHSPVLVKAAIQQNNILSDAENYRFVQNHSPQIFEQMCRLKFEREQNGEKLPSIDLADQWIAENLTGGKCAPSVANQNVEEWEKYGSTSIWHNMPYDDHGTRLRALFDFASRRILKVQQMPDGEMKPQSDLDFNDVSGDYHLKIAAEELTKQGGNATPGKPDKKPGSTLNPVTST